MTEFAKRSGLLELDSNFIHVAGTNGKGSVTAYLQSIFAESGFRTGAFFSPYVYEPRERVQFGRELISRPDFARIVSALRPIEMSLSETEFGGVTEFEMKTAVGFKLWQEKHCEWVALEVGLGGRLDSTNIVTPKASVIVSIGLDHTAILGDSYAQIAYEKAGIIKPETPVIVGLLPEEAMTVVESEAQRMNAPIWRLGKEIALTSSPQGAYTVRTPNRTVPNLIPGLVGSKQPENIALAVSACIAAGMRAEDTNFQSGVRRAYAPGRFETRELEGRLIILDGAHNSEAAEALVRTLAKQHPGQTFALITGMVSGHDPVRFFSPLSQVAKSAFFAPIDFHRAIVPRMLAETTESLFTTAVPCDSVKEALDRAWLTGLPILVTGSFYLVGEVGNYLGLGTYVPPRQA